MPADDEARGRLTTNDSARRRRRLWRALPGGERCKICLSPFGAPIGPILRLAGKGRWHGNPRYCSACFHQLYTTRRGAEVDCTLFFADVRGSTTIAESMSPAEYRALMDRFYRAAVDILVGHEAVVDKFVGDEVVGILIPAMVGNDHARGAIEAGLELLRATGNDGPNPWVPIGIGVNSGVAYVGAVGTAEHVEFTALGDAVNVTARLAAVAGPGELLITDSAAAAASQATAGLERRTLELKGKTESTGVFVLRARA